MVWLQILATVVVCGAIIADVAKSEHRDEQCQTGCNSCALLKQKEHWSLCGYKYLCSKYGSFDKPPIFCTDYRKRSDEE